MGRGRRNPSALVYEAVAILSLKCLKMQFENNKFTIKFVKSLKFYIIINFRNVKLVQIYTN
jgi:hypothetical protein